MYARKIDPGIPQPIKKLIGFKRIEFGKSEEKTIRFTMDTGLLSYWDVEQQKDLIETGEYEIQVARSSNDIRLRQIIVIK